MISTNIFDIIILVIFFSSILIGFSRGFISEMISLITLIAAFIVASLFASPVANMFTSSAAVQSAVSQSSTAIGMSTAQPVSYIALGVSFAIIFGVTILIGVIVKSILNVAFQTGILGIGNRILGAFFGAVRGFLLNLVLIFVVQLTPVASYAQWQESHYIPMFQPYVGWLGGIVSPALANIKTRFGSAVESVTTDVQGAAGNLLNR